MRVYACAGKIRLTLSSNDRIRIILYCHRSLPCMISHPMTTIPYILLLLLNPLLQNRSANSANLEIWTWLLSKYTRSNRLCQALAHFSSISTPSHIADSYKFVHVPVLLCTLNPRRQKGNKSYTKAEGGGGGQLDPSPLLLTPFIRLTRYLAHTMSVLCNFN